MIFIIPLVVLATLILSLVAFVSLSPQFGGKPSDEQMQRYKKSKNFVNGYFVNLVDTPLQNPDVSMTKAMRDYLSGGVERVPNDSVPFKKIDNDFFDKDLIDAVHVTWLGHSTVLFQFEGLTVLTDPMFGKRAAPVSFLGPKRFNEELPLHPETIPHLDAVIISHDHYDHLDYGTIKALHHKTHKFFVPLGVAPHLLRWGVDSDKIIELDWWESIEYAGVQFIATPARHFSGRRGRDRAKTLWASWVIKSQQHRIYFSGDSGYGDHFKEIGDKYGPFDVTLMENGAYNEAWPYVHMQPEQTVQAHLDLNGGILVPIHWAQFNLSIHAWYEPIVRIRKAASEHGITPATPMIGERFSITEKIPSAMWWKQKVEQRNDQNVSVTF